MENYARWKIVFFVVIVFMLLQGCSTSRNQPIPSKEVDGVNVDSAMILANNLIKSLEINGCGKGYSQSEDLCDFNHHNLSFLKCVRSKEEYKELYAEVMSQITRKIKYDNTCYVRYFWHIEELDDPVTFSTSIELLQNNYAPAFDPDASISYAPVNEYVNNHLITPHIKYIDGKQLGEYWVQNPNLYFGIADSYTYYKNIKDLWESGRITLTSQE